MNTFQERFLIDQRLGSPWEFRMEQLRQESFDEALAKNIAKQKDAFDWLENAWKDSSLKKKMTPRFVWTIWEESGEMSVKGRDIFAKWICTEPSLWETSIENLLHVFSKCSISDWKEIVTQEIFWKQVNKEPFYRVLYEFAHNSQRDVSVFLKEAEARGYFSQQELKNKEAPVREMDKGAKYVINEVRYELMNLTAEKWEQTLSTQDVALSIWVKHTPDEEFIADFEDRVSKQYQIYRHKEALQRIAGLLKKEEFAKRIIATFEKMSLGSVEQAILRDKKSLKGMNFLMTHEWRLINVMRKQLHEKRGSLYGHTEDKIMEKLIEWYPKTISLIKTEKADFVSKMFFLKLDFLMRERANLSKLLSDMNEKDKDAVCQQIEALYGDNQTVSRGRSPKVARYLILREMFKEGCVKDDVFDKAIQDAKVGLSGGMTFYGGAKQITEQVGELMRQDEAHLEKKMLESIVQASTGERKRNIL